MPFTAADILGGADRTMWADNQALVDRLLDKVVKPNPPEEEKFLSPPKSPAELEKEVLTQRKTIVEQAHVLNSRISMEKLAQVADTVFNDGYSLELLKQIAAVDLADTSLQGISNILSGIAGPDRIITEEDVEAIIAIARATVRYTLTHGGRIDVRSFSITRTPLEAWRLKEAIHQQMIADGAPLQVDNTGYNNKHQAEELYANFGGCDVVLWNRDIWWAAIRGHENFLGTPITEDIVDIVTPMFWQYDHQFVLKGDGLEGIKMPGYDCAGFTVMPHREKLHELEIPQHLVKHQVPNPDGGVLVTLDDSPGVRELIKDSPFIFGRRGISIGLVFVPTKGKGETLIRLVRPVYEGDDIEARLMAIIMAGAKFLTLKYVAKVDKAVSNQEIKRTDRKLFKQVRQGKVQIPPIKLINLRRPENQGKAPKASTGSRAFTCHFLVEPHWRKQWYATIGKHKPKRIESYIKGDLTKPFKPPREKVFKAVR